MVIMDIIITAGIITMDAVAIIIIIMVVMDLIMGLIMDGDWDTPTTTTLFTQQLGSTSQEQAKQKPKNMALNFDKK